MQLHNEIRVNRLKVTCILWKKECLVSYLDLDTRTIKGAHLNVDKIESNLSVAGIYGYQENTLMKGFEMSTHLIGL